MNLLSSSAFALAIAAVAVVAPGSSARAQCWGICGSVYIAPPSPRRTVIRVSPYRVVTQPRTVIVQAPVAPPPPTVVIVQPPQRQVYVTAPPPPPPQHYYAPQQEPEYEYAQPEPQPVAQPEPQPERNIGRVGLHASVGGIFASDTAIGGFAGALRLRPSDHFAFDIGVGAYGGQDWHGYDRIEVPITVDLLAFVNPQHRMQLYFVVGAGTSLAFLSDDAATSEFQREYTYLGGQAGIGLEWRLLRRLALNVDARAFLRRRIDSSEPEFVDGDRQTNTSAGGLANLGMTLYL